jgi:hypothetical protein
MVRAEQHFMSTASTHVVDKVPWISARLVRGSIDKDVRIFHDKAQHLIKPRHSYMAAYDT